MRSYFQNSCFVFYRGIQTPRNNFSIVCARGVGNLKGRASPGVGILTFVWVGWGKLNRKGQVPIFFGRGGL